MFFFVKFCLDRIGIPVSTVELGRWLLCNIVIQFKDQTLAYQCIMSIENTSQLRSLASHSAKWPSCAHRCLPQQSLLEPNSHEEASQSILHRRSQPHSLRFRHVHYAQYNMRGRICCLNLSGRLLKHSKNVSTGDGETVANIDRPTRSAIMQSCCSRTQKMLD